MRGEIEERFASILHAYEVERAAFEKFKRDCGYAGQYVSYMGPELLDEKLLEHFVSIELIEPKEGEVFIDIGSAASPFSEYAGERLGCDAYQLDLAYEPGVHGRRIGASAAAIPMEAGSVDAMTLHCTIDHFEGYGDTEFIREAGRVLRPGGRVCVLPVYLASEAANIVDPRRYSPRAILDPEAQVRVVAGYNNRFGRFYSVATFERRIMEAAREAFEVRLYRVGGERRAIPNVYLDYALLLTKK